MRPAIEGLRQVLRSNRYLFVFQQINRVATQMRELAMFAIFFAPLPPVLRIVEGRLPVTPADRCCVFSFLCGFGW